MQLLVLFIPFFLGSSSANWLVQHPGSSAESPLDTSGLCVLLPAAVLSAAFEMAWLDTVMHTPENPRSMPPVCLWPPQQPLVVDPARLIHGHALDGQLPSRPFYLRGGTSSPAQDVSFDPVPLHNLPSFASLDASLSTPPLDNGAALVADGIPTDANSVPTAPSRGFPRTSSSVLAPSSSLAPFPDLNSMPDMLQVPAYAGAIGHPASYIHSGASGSMLFPPNGANARPAFAPVPGAPSAPFPGVQGRVASASTHAAPAPVKASAAPLRPKRAAPSAADEPPPKKRRGPPKPKPYRKKSAGVPPPS